MMVEYTSGPEARTSRPERLDIFTEPDGLDVERLRNLGPLAPLAGTWEGSGVDRHPVATGAKTEPYRERMVLEVIDPQTNGPELLYGLRYHVHINNDELLRSECLVHQRNRTCGVSAPKRDGVLQRRLRWV
jgi:hypothetical protein